ncbi:permease-like cell division protein FtsX [Micromonospora sp. GCM10011542]|uniref:permease-like cell division protein FtsX n=1 Tax=Micromonospora sp. GCM10011542 TaxID=3317337 RepID=UPI00361B31FD
MRRPTLASAIVLVVVLLSGCTDTPRPEDRPENLTVSVFLTSDATAPQTRAIEDRLRAVPDVTSVRFLDQAAAYEKFTKDSPELMDSIRSEQLPTSFELGLVDRQAFDRSYRGPLRADLRQLPGVDQVIFRGKPTQASVADCVSERRTAPVAPETLDIDVFLTDGTTDLEKQAIEARLRAIPGGGAVTIRSREESYQRAKAMYEDIRPEIFASAKPEDLPEVLVLTMTDREAAYRANDQKVDEQVCRLVGVDHVLIPPRPASAR